MDLTWKHGDTSEAINAALTYGTTPVNITSATVDLILQPSTGSAVTVTMSHVSDSGGTVRYFPTGTEHAPSNGLAEIRVTFQNGTVKRFPSDGYITYSIQPNLG